MGGEFRELAAFDQSLLDQCSISIAGKQIALQFPPFVDSDGKTAKWNAVDAGAYEPIKVFDGAEARAFSVKLKYVVTGGKWTPERVAQVGRDIRAYFYQTVIAGYKGYPTVTLRLYEIIPAAGGTLMTCRMENVRTTYSGGIIARGGKAFPLITEHVLALETATRIGGIQGGIIGALGSVGGLATKLKTKILAQAPAPEWF
jgi:hypothetical protein